MPPTPSETITLPGYKAGTFGSQIVLPDQTQVIQTVNRGLYSPQNPYPTDPIGGTLELTKQAVRQANSQFGKTAVFVAEQAGLHLFNPYGANIVNPLVITNAIPAEGIFGTALDGEDKIQKQFAEPPGSSIAERIGSAAAGGNLGQEEGASFFAATKIRTVSELVDYGINALAGALGIKNTIGDTQPLSPKAASFEKRLEQNPLSPNRQSLFGFKAGIVTPADAYNVMYSLDEISGVKTTSLARGFMPIEDGALIEDNLLEDTMLRDNLERAFESNSPYDKRDRSYTFQDGVNITVDGDAHAFDPNNWQTAPPVQPGGMIFPFYFESLNSFSDPHIEKFITFQATFNGLRESYVPSWDQKVFFGRPTAVYTYNSTARTIGFNFVIWAPNRIALGLVKERVNWLARHCYPTYDTFGTSRIIKEAPVIRFTIGDVFRDVPGVITSLTFDWTDRWELTRDLIMPQAVKVDIAIAILHDKFMQNAARAAVSIDGNISSDFYEFIKPPRRGISDPKNVSNVASGKMGDIFGALTEGEMGGIVDEAFGIASGVATTFVGNSLGKFGGFG